LRGFDNPAEILNAIIIIVIIIIIKIIEMATTIQISEDTKKKLFHIINHLEKEWGRRITYDEAIKFLLKDENIKFNRNEFLRNIKKFQGIFKPGEGKNLLKESREKDYEREKRF